MRRNTAEHDLLECIGSWPGELLEDLIADGELNHSTSHLIGTLTRMRSAGLVEKSHPAPLRIRPGWEEAVENMYKRDQFAAAAIAAGARSYKQLSEATGRSLTSCYHSGARLTKAGAIYNSRAMYLTGLGMQEFLKIRRLAG
jgi:hypothetical protein